MPEPAHLRPEQEQRLAVRRHAVVADVPTDNRAHPGDYFGNGVVHASSEFGVDRISFACNRLPIVCRRTVKRPLPLFFA